MGLFRRKGSEVDAVDDQVDEAGVESGEDADAPAGSLADSDAPIPGEEGGADAEDSTVSREGGPFDFEEYEAQPDGETRLDLGGILMPGVDGMQLQMQSEVEGGPIVAVTAMLGSSAMQIQPFAAPRSGGYWAEVRAEILEQLDASAKGREVVGPFGKELQAIIPAVTPEGEQVAQPARFVGIDGPRWFLRAVFLGDAALDPSAGRDLEDVLRKVVVRRGQEAMAPGTPIPMHLPEEVPQGIAPVGEDGDEADDQARRDDLNPFERGPEITEIR